MRRLLMLLGVAWLGGCGADPVTLTAVTVGTAAGSIAVMHRTPVDAVVSLASGRDCSVVRLDQGKSYCKPPEARPATPPYCTRSLGVVDCWFAPEAMPGVGHEVADGPRTLTPAQDANRTRWWPF